MKSFKYLRDFLIKMPQLIKADGELVGIITDPSGQYLEDIVNAKKIIREHSVEIASLPKAIQAMHIYKEVREAVRITGLNTSTNEYGGIRKRKTPSGRTVQERTYEVVHGSLFTPMLKLLEDSNEYISYILEKQGIKIPNNNDYLIACVDDEIWEELGERKFSDGVDKQIYLPQFHVDEIRMGKIPCQQTSYRIFAYESDIPNLLSERRLNRDMAMQNDRLLMLTGFRENQERYVKMMFDSKENGGENLQWIDNRCPVVEIGRNINSSRATNLNIFKEADISPIDAITQSVAIGNGSEGLRGTFDSGRLLLYPNSINAYQEIHVFDEKLASLSDMVNAGFHADAF